MFRNTGLAMLDVQAMFNASPNAYVVMDRALVIVGANQAYLTVTGRAASELIGRGLFEAFPSAPDAAHGQQLRQSFARVLASGLADHVARIHYPITLPDGGLGEQVWSATHIPVCDGDGRVTHILQHTENITDLEAWRARSPADAPAVTASILRRAEASQATIASLSNELQLLRSIFEQAPGFTAILRGPTHQFELVNTAYLQLVGQRELIGRTVREALPELDGQGLLELLDQVYAGGQAHVGRNVAVQLRSGADGPLEERFVDFVFQPIRQADGQVRGLFVQGHDLSAQVAAQRRADSAQRQADTAQRQADTAQRQADTTQRRFETLAHTLPLHVWTAQPDGRIEWCNGQVLDYLGMPLDEALATGWLDIVHPEDRAVSQAAWRRSLDDGRDYLVEFRLRHRDGGYRWHLARAKAVRDADGRITQWVGSNTDIHDQKAGSALLADLNNVLARRVDERTAELVRTQDALRHSQQLEAIGSLSGGVAHEFNNLLQVIGGNLQMMARGSLPADDWAERLGQALAGVQRGADLSRQLLAYGRRQPLQPEVVRLDALLHGLHGLLGQTLGEQVQIHTVVADALWPTLVDPANLETVLLNLALNARDAMAGNGRLTIEASNAVLDEAYAQAVPEVQAGDYVLIAVSDSGHGMSEAVQERAFEPFFTTKPRGKGSGLGLSMVFGFAKQSGGHVKLYSELGHGTTVRLYLPRSNASAPSAPQPRPPAPAPDAAPARRGRVLVVEDDDAVRDTVVAMLRLLGHEVTAARDGSSALQVIDSAQPIDLLFTDVVMPGPVSSTELARQAQLARPGLRVLFTSGYTENALLHGGRIDAGLQLLSKPYTREALARKLDQLLSPAGIAAQRHVLLCEDDELVRDSLTELLTGMGCSVSACGSLAEARSALAVQTPDLLITDLALPDGQGLDLAREARALSARMLIAVASGRGGREAAAQVRDALHLDKPFGIDDLEDLLARMATG
ncbi:hybrid sensor histidine kinase/response regulator [Aquabacterium sp. OR-4]|uniref:hybrid sensor histidine kinase/response regulator n=1 Tax=Aquabacterium sp. OR-4 TaxID=2978127 RepID=UPI0021B410A4|nr:PAS domain-containing protein [Aquabacterium sp. OR-4]MDT7835053.1 PAS domain-containing protein [Aquabacterium sp. OR-4]